MELGQDAHWRSLVSCPGLKGWVYFSQSGTGQPSTPISQASVWGNAQEGEKERGRGLRRHPSFHLSPFPCFSLAQSPQQHMSLIKCSLRHQLVNSRLQENREHIHPRRPCDWVCDSLLFNMHSIHPNNSTTSPILSSGRLQTLMKSIIRHTCSVTVVGFFIYQMQLSMAYLQTEN